MARPKSEDKYQALLAAAVAVCSVLGLEAPTSKIARTAGSPKARCSLISKPKMSYLTSFIWN
jgi:hypothetical protein